jgi:hypothetical protein
VRRDGIKKIVSEIPRFGFIYGGFNWRIKASYSCTNPALSGPGFFYFQALFLRAGYIILYKLYIVLI